MRLASVLALTCCGLSLVSASATAALALNREAVMAGSLWQLWTGHLVHFSAGHAVIDIATVFLLTLIAERELGTFETARVILIGAPLISVGLLLLAPNLMIYQGSSALSALLGVTAGRLIWQRSPSIRPALGLVGLLTMAKTLADAMQWAPEWSSLPSGVRVAWQAHLVAMVMGVFYRPIRLGFSHTLQHP